MIKSFKYAVAALALTATAGFGAEPWNSAAPRGTTSAHQQMAAQAAQVHAQVAFGINPLGANWSPKDRTTDTPVSNVHASTLKAAITGRYHVYQDPGQKGWSARYYAADGTTYFCHAMGRHHREEKRNYAVTHTRFGLAGILHWDRIKPSAGKDYAWPLVVDSNTGEIGIFNYHRSRWKSQLGWIQSEYAPAFAEHCPKLPRVNAVSNQTGDTLQELARGARPVRIQPAFANSSRNPLTAGMYYHFNPPVR
jgi:hypothetical protein